MQVTFVDVVDDNMFKWSLHLKNFDSTCEGATPC